MGIACRLDLQKKRLWCKVEGEVTYEEMYNHLIEERKAHGLSYPEVVDARTAVPALTSADVRSLVGLLRALGHKNDLGPTAFLVATEVAYGIVRMVGMLVGDLCQVAPFWSEDEAEYWILRELRGDSSSHHA